MVYDDEELQNYDDVILDDDLDDEYASVHRKSYAYDDDDYSFEDENDEDSYEME